MNKKTDDSREFPGVSIFETKTLTKLLELSTRHIRFFFDEKLK